MDTLIQPTLSEELQELYLENKEWLSDILFVEDEVRFLKKVTDQVLLGKIQQDDLRQIEMINESLNVILERRKQLRSLLDLRKHKLEQLLRGSSVAIGVELIEEDAAIIVQIKSLMAAERIRKQELFKLAKQQKLKNRPIGTNKPLKV
ncbi:hypothetical protein [Pedobacter sp. JCM 36344]|uniref:hypothetical protein n=1 Tax=Pedobacter sp. JCM 36344 TaxID=3374280 RepID=UPI0039788934